MRANSANTKSTTPVTPKRMERGQRWDSMQRGRSSCGTVPTRGKLSTPVEVVMNSSRVTIAAAKLGRKDMDTGTLSPAPRENDEQLLMAKPYAEQPRPPTLNERTWMGMFPRLTAMKTRVSTMSAAAKGTNAGRALADGGKPVPSIDTFISNRSHSCCSVNGADIIGVEEGGYNIRCPPPPSPLSVTTSTIVRLFLM